MRINYGSVIVEGYTPDQAAAIVANASRKASPKAKKANPNLKKVTPKKAGGK